MLTHQSCDTKSILTNTFQFARASIEALISVNSETCYENLQLGFLSRLIFVNFARKIVYGNEIVIMLHYA